MYAIRSYYDVTIPVHGSYADYFWGTADQYYRTPAFSFSNMRAVDDVDTESNPMDENEIYDIEEYNNNPYMTCETGIGINIAFHRRPNVTPKDRITSYNVCYTKLLRISLAH